MQMIQIDEQDWINEDKIIMARLHPVDHPNRPERMLEVIFENGANISRAQVQGLWIGSVMSELGIGKTYLRDGHPAKTK